MNKYNRYDKDAVQREIDKDKTINKKRAKLIHALLEGKVRGRKAKGKGTK